ncbi:MAG: hypothetical protein VCB77_08095 [Alphaproteobacteria bacterium]
MKAGDKPDRRKVRTVSSQEWLEREQAVLIDGGSSAFRGPRVFKPYPPYMAGASGARLTDVEGHEHNDWMMAFGALPLGHAHPAVVEVALAAIAIGPIWRHRPRSKSSLQN